MTMRRFFDSAIIFPSLPFFRKYPVATAGQSGTMLEIRGWVCCRAELHGGKTDADPILFPSREQIP